MRKKTKARCSLCKKHECKHDKKDCFGSAEAHLALYDDELKQLHKAATAVEGRHYCRAPRLQEVILFAKEAGFRKLGIAFCIGLTDEARVIDEILARDFEIASVCCKLSAIDKRILGLEQIDADAGEVMCNPAGQADILNGAGTELNIICGLCVGHDAIFSLKSQAPVTTLIAKDRVLAHNPAGAVYNQYVRKRYFGLAT
jgi:uncharacterized metal-binding protein